tara:strand:+ start:9531 stop:10238 length:708 start_codon:yes stop_codon:yes gene_type:complete
MGKSNVICIIPARKNSKGVKNKNIQKINGKELIKYPFDLAHKSKYIDEIVFSTDSRKYINILQKNKKFKKKTHFLLRPKKLAQDNSSSYSVIDHAIKKINKNVGIVVLLEPTSPLTTKKDLDFGIKKLLNKNSKFESVVSIVSNPKFNSNYKFKINRNNKIINLNKNINKRRQKVLGEYVLSGNFYISRKDSLDRNKNFTSKKTYGFVIKKKYYTDIDDHLDLKFANLLCKLNKK